ncbi:hypothetical protein EHN07_11825 [Buttiauxella warmboldiae]|uniref:Uncharacterized protein n=1 Tax=Buttiauxella warmboldiae TaxID=82993 RepID=A0A3N5E916_9ENTR|nr:hypothetical protein EHN07_11825 [Buttiauxella warmboldiae]
MAAIKAGPINARRNLRAVRVLLLSTRLFVILPPADIAFAMFQTIKNENNYQFHDNGFARYQRRGTFWRLITPVNQQHRRQGLCQTEKH